MSNVVAIVGRPNVGKSTLFNRLVEERQAITDDQSGVTRDRHYGLAEWCNVFFSVIDTGGYVTESDDVFESAIRRQVEIAVEEADVVIFVVDCMAGLHELDKSFAQVLRRYKKSTFLVANKADTPLKTHEAAEFYALGFDEIYPVSAQNGSGTGELLDGVIKLFQTEGEANPFEGLPRLAILGRPNVGKSSFLNALLGKERTIVSDIAGTTRDSVHTRYTLYGKDFVLTDTAGIRRKSRVKESIEFYSVMRTLKALEDTDVCILMIDATQNEGLESQDMAIVRLAQDRYKGLMIMVNKWDLVEKDTNTAVTYEKKLRAQLAPADHIPIIFTSVLTKKRIFQCIEKAVQVYENRRTQIATSVLNDKLLPEIERYPPPSIKGKYIKIKYITQLPSQVPTFAFFCNLPQYIKQPYMRYLENKIRDHFGLEGSPIRLFFRQK
ncbi:MAG: ribosome biogenesis GTPase Der [Cytophagales bacterium]|nr:MAG: ribosome biogenesis GTPase Der [Cytophagales bacterium]TAF62519.1 MAG: ribosome biogenesis GTPase Der [Cytophagales bacterium]